MEVIWSVLTPGVSALLGAWVGARIALDRFKKERTFDKRLDWHVGALRVIHDLELAHQRLKLHEQERPPEYAVLREGLDRAIAEAPAYMTGLQWRRLRLAKEELWDTEHTMRDLIRDGKDLEVIAQAISAEGSVIKEAERIVIAALTKLMPPDPDFPWISQMKARFLRIRRK
jgi:hypothetical protein